MNMNTYKKIGRAEFENALETLGGFEVVSVPNTKELVYHVPTGVDGIVVRVFSSLSVRDDVSRDAGNDAIRTVLWNAKYSKPMGKSTRTNRIQTWETNLSKKVLALCVEAAARADEVADDDNETAYNGLPNATGAKDEIVVADVVATRYGKKAVLESPFAAKDAIKALDWQDCHRAWDADAKAWTVDADALALVVESLGSAGWNVVKPAADDDETDALDMDELALDAIRGDEIVVTYVSKNTKREMTKSGIVRRGGAEGRISFERADGQLMHVTKDGLFTSMSAYPFVGALVDVQLIEQ